MYMQKNKKKGDLMMSAMDDFWGSDYKIGAPKVNVPKLKSNEDDAYDALWGRGQFMKQPKVKSYDASTGSRYVQNVKPVSYKNNIVQQKQNQLKAMLIQQRIDSVNRMNFARNVKEARALATAGRDVARAAYGTTKSVVSKATPVAKKVVSEVKESVRKFVSKVPVNAKVETPPVGLGGAIYTAKKERGESSIYD